MSHVSLSGAASEELRSRLLSVRSEAPIAPLDEHVTELTHVLGDWEEGMLSTTQLDQVAGHLLDCGYCLHELAPLIESGHLPLPAAEWNTAADKPSIGSGSAPQPVTEATMNREVSTAIWVMRVVVIGIIAVTIAIVFSLVRPRRGADVDLVSLEQYLDQGEYEAALTQSTRLLESIKRSDDRRRLIAIAEDAAAGAGNDALMRGDYERVSEIREIAAQRDLAVAELAVASYVAQRGLTTPNVMRVRNRLDRDYGYNLMGDRHSTQLAEGRRKELRKLGNELALDLKRFPGHRLLKLNRGQLLLDLGEVEAAREVFEEVQDSDPSDVDAQMGIGIAAFLGKDEDRAASYFMIVSDVVQPQDVAAKLNWAIVLMRQGQSEEAKELLREVADDTDEMKLEGRIRQFLASYDLEDRS